MFKDRYQAVLAEYEKFWERKNTERCILDISYAQKDAKRYRDPQSLEEKRLDAEYNYNAFKSAVEGKGYIAEGIPRFFVDFGPGCLTACIGGGYELAPNTIWFDRVQLVKDWDNPPKIGFDEQSEMWQHITRMQNRFAVDPDVCFSITDIGGIMDVVAALRGTEKLLYDLYDYPEEVVQFAQKVKAEWFKMFDKQVEILRQANQVFTSWMNIPSKKPWYPLQCDFCYMISPAQFEKFVLGDIVDQVNYMERSIYHLDGVGELPHLDSLLDIPGLTGIQWVPGAGQESICNEKWFDLYRRIQDKKKNLVLMGGISERNLKGAERLIKSIDPVGVYISVNCSSREKAEEILEKVIRWSE